MAGSAGKGDAAGQDAPQPRCVVWLSPDHPVPRALLQGLARRRVAMTIVHDAPSVMRELAMAMAGASVSAAGASAVAGLEREKRAGAFPIAVVVIEPEQQCRVDELCAAVRRYFPHARLWQYQARDARGRPWLARINGTLGGGKGHGRADRAADRGHGESGDSPAAGAERAELTVTPIEMNGAPLGGGAADSQDVRYAAVTGAADAEDVRAGKYQPPPLSSLTAEELAMLLGSEAPDEAAERSDVSSAPGGTGRAGHASDRPSETDRDR